MSRPYRWDSKRVSACVRGLRTSQPAPPLTTPSPPMASQLTVCPLGAFQAIPLRPRCSLRPSPQLSTNRCIHHALQCVGMYSLLYPTVLFSIAFYALQALYEIRLIIPLSVWAYCVFSNTYFKYTLRLCLRWCSRISR